MKFSAILLAALSVVSATDVVQLTGKTFDKFVAKNPLVIAEFFAPWCGHCKALEPEYEKAATSLKDHGIQVAKIDCTEEADLCSEHGVQGYPTLKVFKGKDNVDKYEGGRTADDIVQFMVRRSQPPVVPIADSDALDAFLADNTVAVVAYYDDATTNKTLNAVAETFRDRLSFAQLSAKSNGVKKSKITVVKQGEDEPVVYEGKLNEKDLIDFLNAESFPTFGEIGPSNYVSYAQSGVPILFAFVENDEQRDEIRSHLTPHVGTLKGKANIVFLDTKKFGGHAENVNLRNEFPAIVVHDFATNKKYVHDQDTPLSKKSIDEYVDAFASGKLAPFIKSAEIPESQDEAVYVLVGKEYDSVVLENDNDVLVEFYAPWCGHCKNLAPIYEELAEAYADHPEVVVAKLDHTANEVPDQIQGYPTIKLFPAGAKDKPITYEGPRTFDDLAKFIKENGSHKIDAEAAGDEESAEAEDDTHEEL